MPKGSNEHTFVTQWQQQRGESDHIWRRSHRTIGGSGFYCQRWVFTMKLFLAIETQRSRCLGTLIRCASAFGASAVLVVGSPHYSTHGAHGAQKYLQVIHFHYWAECVDFLRTQDCSLYGICPSSSSKVGDSVIFTNPQPIDRIAFQRSVCFLLGPRNDLTGEIISYCEALVYVPVPDMQRQHLVHYDAKVSVCLQAAALQGGFVPTAFSGGKHDRQKVERIELPSRAERKQQRQQEQAQQQGARALDDEEEDGGEEVEGALGLLFSTT